MVVQVLSLLSNNIVKATGNDWYELYKKVKKIREENPADEVITLDFKGVDVRFDSDSLYATNIVALPNVNITLYNNMEVWAALRVVALLKGKAEDTVKNVLVEVKTVTVAPPTEKEKRNAAEKAYFKKRLKDIFVYQGVMRVSMTKLVSEEIPSIRSKDRGDNFRNALREIADEFEAAGNALSKIVVDTRDCDVAPHVKDALADEAGDYAIKGIKISLISGDSEENRRLQLRTDIGRRTIPDSDKLKVLQRLGFGTVGILTKFKKRKKDNIELRLEDVVTNQYIAIFRQMSEDNTVAVFECYKYSELVSKWDEYNTCGEILDAPNSQRKEVRIEGLGLERVCIGSTWHFNRFDGAAEGEKTRKTYTGVDGANSGHLEEVVIPEYIRRALLSYEIRFKEASLKSDAEQFKIDMEKVKNENGRG